MNAIKTLDALFWHIRSCSCDVLYGEDLTIAV